MYGIGTWKSEGKMLGTGRSFPGELSLQGNADALMALKAISST